jgi:hypothetical protein
MLMLYAAVPAGACDAPPGDLAVIDSGEAGVVFACCAETPTRERNAVLGFGRAVVQLAQRCTILPMRYGTVVSGVPELRKLLAERGTEWRTRLDAVAGHVEMLVRWEASEPLTRGGASGRDYLLARVASTRLGRDRVEGLLGALGQLTADHRLLPSPDSTRLACLVPQEVAADFEELLRAHAAATGEPVSCTGPWPPFSFAQESSGG